jgi:hypothetical protein
VQQASRSGPSPVRQEVASPAFGFHCDRETNRANHRTTT